jgi:hypothetical protein
VSRAQRGDAVTAAVRAARTGLLGWGDPKQGANEVSPGRKENPMYLEMLLDQVEGSADWRADKAAQYPDDRRNERSSAALSALAKNLRALPANDKHVRAYEAVVERLVDLDVDTLTEMTEHETRYVGRYGFDYPADGDAREFLSALTEAHQELVDDAETEAAEAEQDRRYEAAAAAASAEVKALAHEQAETVADAAAKQAAQKAYRTAHDDAYPSAYKEALIRLLHHH